MFLFSNRELRLLEEAVKEGVLYDSLELVRFASNRTWKEIKERFLFVNEKYLSFLLRYIFQREEEDAPVLSENEFEERIRIWNSNLEQQKEKFEKIDRNLKTLSQFGGFEVSEFRLSRFVLFGTPISSVEYLPNDILEIFNEAILSIEIPFLSATISGKTWYKVYSGSDGPDPNFFLDLIPPEKDYVISFIMWIDQKQTKQSFVLGSFNLNERKISIPIPLFRTEISSLKTILSNTFRNFDFSNLEIEDIGGSFIIENAPEISNIVLTDLVFFDPILSESLFLEESKNTLDLKSRVRFHLKSFLDETSLVSFSKKYFSRSNRTNLLVSVVKAKSMDSIDFLRNILPSLLSYANSKSQETRKIYLSFIPNLSFEISKETEELKREADPFEISGYSRICQKQFQPKRISADEIGI
jgi:hypothetical protein